MVKEQTLVSSGLVERWERIIQDRDSNLSSRDLFLLGQEILQAINGNDWQYHETVLPHASGEIYLDNHPANHVEQETLWIEITSAQSLHAYSIQKDTSDGYNVSNYIQITDEGEGWEGSYGLQEIQLPPEEITNIARQLLEAYKNSYALSRP